MDASDYITQRVDDQIGWYDRKSRTNQQWYKLLRTVEFTGAAFIPFLATYLEPGIPKTKIIIGILGVLITVITATLSLYRHQEHWVEYRTTCESLKKEKFLFLTGSGPYVGASATTLQIFVDRVETLISKQNSNWAQYMTQQQEEEEKENG